MDRHCLWINNCIGVFNLKYYMLFLGYMTAACAVSSMVLGYDAMYYTTSAKRYRMRAAPVLCGTFSLLLSLFLMFLGCGLLLEQVVNIQSNQTAIDKIQKNVTKHVRTT